MDCILRFLPFGLTARLGMKPFTRAVAIAIALCVATQMVMSQRDIILYCDVCKGALDEIDWAMSQGSHVLCFNRFSYNMIIYERISNAIA